MSGTTKATTLAILAVLGAAGGEYLAGFLTLWALHLDQVPLEAVTYWRYVRALELPQVVPYATKIKLCGAAGFGVPLVAWLLVLVPLLRGRAESMHGEARFAKLSDLKKAGLLTQTPQSILLGKFRGRYLWLGGAQHVITISPTRSGKTTSIAIPVLLSYQQSMVVLDLKGELHKATSGWREQQGQLIRVWAPYDENGDTHRFNPMTTLEGMSPDKRIGEIQTIAAILYPDQPGGDPFWTSQSRAAFTAFTSYLFEAWEHKTAGRAAGQGQGQGQRAPGAEQEAPLFPSFERVLRFSSGEHHGNIRETLEQLLKDPSYDYISPQTRTVFGNLVGLAEQTFSSVIASMQAPLQQFLSPILAAATNASDIDVTSLRKRLTTLYVIIPTNKLDESAKLLNIFFSTVIGNNLGRQLGEDPELRYQMLMLMDEFTAMGRVDVWAKRISISASYGVRDLCIVQSRAQLRAAYGDHDAENFITNHGAQIVFAPREQADANQYSEMLGYKTVRKEHRNTSRGSGSHQVSTSHSEERRALLLPQEIKELPGDEELIFYEGCKPIRARKNWFFKDKVFRKRASVAPVWVLRKKSDPMPGAVRPADERAVGSVLDALRQTSRGV
jgi:type IV secretion system protein VirD4